MIDKNNRENLINKWDFNWPLMEVLIGGRSSIDLPMLQVEDSKEANEFVLNYGFDADDESDQRRLHSFIIEALNFIQNELMPKEWKRGRRPPEEVFRCQDIRNLLLWASIDDTKHAYRSKWSCAVLRVVHTIAHLQGVQKLADIKVARRQIMGRFERYLFRDENVGLRLGDEENSVSIERVEWKNFKTRESIILKLLHKQGNVAEMIYDFLGIRIITKQKSDVMMVVKFFREFYMVTFPNMSPARSRNTVLGLDEFRDFVALYRQKLKDGEINPEEFLDLIENDFEFANKASRSSNPHSSTSYKSIQLTCRQLIRYDDPVLDWSKKIENFLEGDSKNNIDSTIKSTLSDTMSMFRDNCELAKTGEVSVFFPFEVQIMDSQSNTEGQSGDASHARYKKSQVRAARKRVLGDILKK